jgi:hypothetical protein
MTRLKSIIKLFSQTRYGRTSRKRLAKQFCRLCDMRYRTRNRPEHFAKQSGQEETP